MCATIRLAEKQKEEGGRTMEDQDRKAPDEEREYKLPPDVEAHGKFPPAPDEDRDYKLPPDVEAHRKATEEPSELGDDEPDVEAHKRMTT
jgi:hypothetical protein